MARKKKAAPVEEVAAIEQESSALAPKEVTQTAQVKMTDAGIVEVPLSKTTGEASKKYLPTSGRMVSVFSKFEQALTYNTPYGPVTLACKTHKGAIVVNGFAVTSIPIEAWNYIAKVYGSGKMFKNHFVYVAESVEAGKDHAKELRDMKTGIEPLNPKEQHSVLPQGQSDDGIVTTYSPD